MLHYLLQKRQKKSFTVFQHEISWLRHRICKKYFQVYFIVMITMLIIEFWRKKEKKIIVSTKFHYIGFLRSVQSWQTFLHAPVLRNPGHPLPPPVLHELPELLEGEAISAGRRHPPPPLAGGAPPPASGGGLATPLNDRVNKNIQCQDKKKKLFNDRLILAKIF